MKKRKGKKNKNILHIIIFISPRNVNFKSVSSFESHLEDLVQPFFLKDTLSRLALIFNVSSQNSTKVTVSVLSEHLEFTAAVCFL